MNRKVADRPAVWTNDESMAKRANEKYKTRAKDTIRVVGALTLHDLFCNCRNPAQVKAAANNEARQKYESHERRNGKTLKKNYPKANLSCQPENIGLFTFSPPKWLIFFFFILIIISNDRRS